MNRVAAFLSEIAVTVQIAITTGRTFPIKVCFSALIENKEIGFGE